MLTQFERCSGCYQRMAVNHCGQGKLFILDSRCGLLLLPRLQQNGSSKKKVNTFAKKIFQGFIRKRAIRILELRGHSHIS